jgi:hypothetical protein
MTSEPHTPCHDPAAAEAPSGASGPATGRRAGDEELRVLLALAESLEGDPAALLDLLRRLEKLHRTIQDGAFRNSLPEDRNRLFQLLESMEDSGGWPYIPRLQLRTFLDLLQREAPREAGAQGEQSLAA